VFDDNIDYSKKYLNRESLDKLFTQKDDCDEIIIIKNKIVTDTSIANIAIFHNGVWITSKNCLLKGTTRNRLLEDKFLVEKDITLNMLKKASKIALMNAMIDFDIKENYSFK
jgi:4-amino-4-deoxychorismate lyase